MINRRQISLGMAATAFGGLRLTAPAMAQPAWPAKTLRIVVPFPPGGAIDAMARIVAPYVEKSLGKPVIIDNKPGAGGVIGTEAVLRAKDEHTLLMTAMGHVIYPYLNKTLSFDPLKDFQPIATIALVPNLVVVPASSPFHSLAELIAYAKAHPGELTYGSAGVGTSLHLTAALFAAMAGITLKHVPYKGSAPAITDLIGGRIDLMFDSSTSSSPMIREGKLRALATATTQRSAALPHLPTIAEAGVPGYQVDWWYGLLAPAGQSEGAVAQVAEAVSEALDADEVKKRFATIQIDPLKTGRPAFRNRLVQDSKTWGAVIQKLGISPE
ncbi:Bug family tripartite tricarboxylate transporter substrate binding protein [Diaphorobacter nitroreducens]|uniref:Bug family tripartite tricarboxylate transporter substrate binding protein n=1 Tax=Diaphorobacter nitroreducens TaxID=164759 RepID=UPI0028963D1F|nr:tripartite tricarboxylate transporter substrate binding protein [Diaphorobacter nitroreducens]